MSILFAFSILLLFAHHADTDFSHNWTIFFLWLVNFGVALYVALSSLPHQLFQRLSSTVKKDKHIIIALLLIAFLTRLAFLNSYPFVHLGDGLRDAGLHALRIHTGQLKDLFGFGTYEGYGNFIPLISYVFSILFKNSPTIYTLPAAIVGILSIGGTYLLARRFFGKYEAVAAAIFLTGSLHHLHFSRTELLVILESLLALPVLAATYLATVTPAGFFLAGLVYGFTLHFYAAIRGLVVITALYLLAVHAIKILRPLRRGQKKRAVRALKSATVGGILLIIGAVIAVGPQLNNFSSANLVGTANAKLILLDDSFKMATTEEKIETLYNTYTDAFLVYFAEPTTTHFRETGPLLAFPANWLFMIGLFSLLTQRKRHNMTNLLLATVLLLPFTNQVLVNHIGADHRMMSVLPAAAIVGGFGLVALVRSITSSRATIKSLLTLFLAVILLGQLYFYFSTRPSDFERDQNGIQEYALQSVADYMRDDKTSTHFYILDDGTFEYFGHHQEKFAFFAAPREVSYVGEGEFVALLDERSAQDRSTFIATSANPALQGYNVQEFATSCKKRLLFPNYNCPKGYHGSYSFYVIR